VRSPRQRVRGLPAWRVGLLGGLTGMLCCVGPTLLALFGVISAGTAYSWAVNLYGGYTWWFRAAGLALIGVVLVMLLRRRGQCSVRGMRSNRRAIVVVLLATLTYLVLYAVTTGLGQLSH